MTAVNSTLWYVRLITLFPELFPGPLGISCVGQALKSSVWSLSTVFLRDFGLGMHKTVDGPPCGGGAGMVLRCDVMEKALEKARQGLEYPRLVYFSPRGRVLTQNDLACWSVERRPLVGICGRYEGLDQRILDHYGIEEISMGDYILAGGEIAAMAMIEGIVRLLPGVMGNENSATEESFAHGLLEAPQYARPVLWNGHNVPSVLVSGHHQKIARWRREQSEKLTQRMRPDLWAEYEKCAKIQEN